MTEERVKRKLSAILSADVAGYSRLMGEDEVSTVRTLEAYRKLMADLIEQFRGRVVDSPGDNLLAEFSSVVDAVQCAVEIHEVIRAKNEELPEDRRMLFRIGVNLGDVIEEGDRIYGDGVNIAARLEGLAEPGGVCISGSAHEQIENKLALGYEYLGEHTVKNIAKPVKVYRVPMGPKAVTAREEKEKRTKLKNWQWTVLGAAGAIIVIIGALAIWNFYLRRPPIEPASIEPEQAPVVSEVEEAPKTIAVLPFDDLSPEKDQEYFVDGLSEEILNFLCQISGLEVMGKTSSFYFKGKNKKVQEIANELSVEYLLEGSVRKAGDSLRITAQLLRGADGFHLWSKTYDKELKVEEMFAVQEAIATAVADELKVTLGIGTSFKQLGGTDNEEAYELYLVAIGQINNTADQAGYKRALQSIEAAIALDPEFAIAWTTKGQIHLFLSVFSPANSAAEEQNAALYAAHKAIELEPNLADAYIVLQGYNVMKCKWIEAESAIRKCLHLTTEPSLYIKSYTAGYYKDHGFFQRVKEDLVEIRQKDPLNQLSRAEYVLNLAFLGDTIRAEEEYERARVLFEGDWDYGDSFITAIRLGTRDTLSLDDIVYSSPIADAVKIHLDSPKEGLAELLRIYRDRDNLSHGDLMEISIWAAYFGDPEFSVKAMEKGLSVAGGGIFHIWLPVMHEVRQTPMFKELMKEIGLVNYWNKFGWPDICRPLDNGDFVCD